MSGGACALPELNAARVFTDDQHTFQQILKLARANLVQPIDDNKTLVRSIIELLNRNLLGQEQEAKTLRYNPISNE